MRAFLILSAFAIGALLAACGRDVTGPATCPAIAANYVGTDTIFAVQGYLPDGTPAPRIVLYLVDIFECGPLAKRDTLR